MASLISVGQVLDRSLEHCRKHFKELLAITLWMVVASIPSIIGKLLAPSGGDHLSLTGGDWLSFAFSLLGAVIVAIISIWIYAVLILAVADEAGGKPARLKQIYQQGWKIFVRYFLLTVCIAAIIIGIALITAPGFVLLFISGSFEAAPPILAALGVPLFLIGGVVSLYLLAKYSVQLAFAPYILLLERTSITEAIKGSLALVKGRWWATLARFAIPKLIYFLILMVLSYVTFTALEVLMAFLVNISTFLTLAVYTFSLFLSVFLSAIVTPVIIATDYYLYDSLRKTR